MAGKDFSVFVNIGGREMPSLAATVRSVTGRMSALSRSMTEHANAQKAAIAGMMQSFKGMAAFAAAGGIAFSMKKAFGAGEDFSHEVQRLRNAGRSAHEVAEGIAAANKSIKNLPTASLTGSIKLLNETTGAFGDYHHAVENLDFNSKLATVLQNTTGLEDPEHDIGSLIKALEIRGSASDPKKYQRESSELLRAMTLFGGRLKADEINTFARNSQQGIRGLSERALTKYMPTLINELGGAGAGTGLTAFRTIISGRKISDQKQAQAWQDLGLLAKKDIIVNKKNGEIKGWRDGAIKGTRLAYKDPMEFLWKVVIPRLKAKGTDTSDPVKLQAALNTLFKNTKAAAFVSAIGTVVDRTRLLKDEKLIEKVLDLNQQYDSSLKNDPKLALRALKTSIENFGVVLTNPLMKPFTESVVAIARAMQRLSGALMANPGLAKAIGGIGLALAVWSTLRLANMALGITALARGLAYLTLASTVGVAARLVGVARGITAISIAASAGAVARVRALGVGIAAVTAIGGGRMALGMVAASIGRLGIAAALFPITALRGIALAMWGLVANPVGVTITAVVVALTALGTWVANNWGGIKGFFLAFGESFMKGIGPGPASAINGLVDGLKGVWDWFSKILGPLDAGGEKWAAWGASAGRGAAAVVAALASLPGQIAALITDFDWGSVGSAIGSGIKSGITSLGGAAVGGVKAGASWLKDKVMGPSVQPRALGGPVSSGRPYLVGEHGPELFVPGSSGSILSNAATRGPTVDASAVARTRALAGETGMALHTHLDAIRKPIVDTSSIDEAAIKVASLGSALGGLGGSLGGVGGGGGMGGGSGGGGGMGGPLAIGKGAGIGHIASKEERAAYIKQAAARLGIDGKIALRVAQSEGFNKYTGDYGTSFGDFQLHTGGRGPRGMRVGGLGDIAMRRGINIHDPKTWKAQTDFALAEAKKSGWGAWHGWRGPRWAGIKGHRATGGPVSGGSPYLVGERGPELFVPGASGSIATNRALASLTDPAAVARLMGGKAGAGVNVTHTRGDSHYSPSFTIQGGGDIPTIKREVESHFWDMVRQAERDQAGSLSD